MSAYAHPDLTIELPPAWRTADFDPHMIEVVAEADLPKGRKALVVMAMLKDGTNVLALAWDRGTRLARSAPPDWKVEEHFTGRPPGPGEGTLITAWRLGVESMLAARTEAEADEARDPEGTDLRAMALFVSRHPDALDTAWQTYAEQHGGEPPLTRELFELGVQAIAEGGLSS